jgi:hypothetical protein
LFASDESFGGGQVVPQGASHVFTLTELWISNLHATVHWVYWVKSSKNPLKETKILQDIMNSITNLKSQHKPKYHLSKILI